MKSVQEPIRVLVLCSSSHLGSTIVVNGLLSNPQVRIVGIVCSPLTLFSAKSRRYLSKTGVYFMLLYALQRCVQSFGFVWARLLGRRSIRTLERVSREEDIPLLQLRDCNSTESIVRMSDLQPDIVVSAYYNQILRKEVLSLPRLACINVHPGWLPRYRGTMAYFWALRNNESECGVTIHLMDLGIDTGAILKRSSFDLEQDWTQQQVLSKTAFVGTELLGEVLKNLVRNDVASKIIDTQGEEEHYYSLPGKSDVNAYLDRRPFFRIRDVLSLLCTPCYPKKHLECRTGN